MQFMISCVHHDLGVRGGFECLPYSGYVAFISLKAGVSA